jgi:uncharacterized protein with GYD domain
VLPGRSYFHILRRLTRFGREGGTDAALSIEVQLHAGDLGQAYRQPGGRPKGCTVVHIESVGGKLHGFWYAFGTHDGYTLWKAPDNLSMAAVALAISGGGALSSLETTVFLTVDETMDALRKADQVQYRAPARSGSGPVSASFSQ